MTLISYIVTKTMNFRSVELKFYVTEIGSHYKHQKKKSDTTFINKLKENLPKLYSNKPTIVTGDHDNLKLTQSLMSSSILCTPIFFNLQY